MVTCCGLRVVVLAYFADTMDTMASGDAFASHISTRGNVIVTVYLSRATTRR